MTVARGGQQRGAGTVWVLAVAALTWFVAFVVVELGHARAVRQQAASAADLAALAGARRARTRPDDGCVAAAAIARANHASLASCASHDRIVDVVTSVRFAGPFGRALAISARARAGPATELRR